MGKKKVFSKFKKLICFKLIFDLILYLLEFMCLNSQINILTQIKLIYSKKLKDNI